MYSVQSNLAVSYVIVHLLYSDCLSVNVANRLMCPVLKADLFSEKKKKMTIFGRRLRF